MPFKGFLGPSWKMGTLTRILRRQNVYYHRIHEYTSGNYRLVESYPNKDVDYEDGTPADVFFFEN